MNQYSNAGAGLKKMFIAQVGAIICTVLTIIPLVNILAVIGALVFAIISMVGLAGAGKDIPGCKTAFILTIVNIVVGFVSGLCAAVPVLGAILSIAESVISFLIVYLVCTSVASVLSGMGVAEVAAKGETVWKLNLVCYVVTIVVSILALIPALAVIAGVATFVVAIVSVVAGILYMIFLNKSYQALGA